MEYEQLTVDEKKQIIYNRLRQYEQDHFNNSLNLESLEASPTPDEGAINATRETVRRLENIITLHRAKVQALDSVAPLALNGTGRKRSRS